LALLLLLLCQRQPTCFWLLLGLPHRNPNALECRDLAGSDSEEGAAGAAVGAAKQGTLDAFVKRSGSQPAAKAAGAAAKAAAAAGKAREKGKGPVRGAANSAKRKVAVSSGAGPDAATAAMPFMCY
jgi:hypothetical protein